MEKEESAPFIWIDGAGGEKVPRNEKNPLEFPADFEKVQSVMRMEVMTGC